MTYLDDIRTKVKTDHLCMRVDSILPNLDRSLSTQYGLRMGFLRDVPFAPYMESDSLWLSLTPMTTRSFVCR